MLCIFYMQVMLQNTETLPQRFYYQQVHNVFYIFTQSSHTFRPYTLATFRELRFGLCVQSIH